MHIFWVDGDAGASTPVGRFRYWDRYQVMRPGGPGAANLVFGRTLQLAAGNDEAFIGESADYEISVYRRDGTLKRLIRHEIPARPVTDSMKRAHEDAGAKAAAERAASRGVPIVPPDEAQYAKTLPAYARLYSGRNGSLWVLRHRVSDATRAERWDVFGSDGHWRATIDLPDGFDLLDAGPDYALGAWRNPDDVEFVHLYRFTMPEIN
jgi:hypothetical protein